MTKAKAIRAERLINHFLGKLWSKGRYMIWGALLFIAVILLDDFAIISSAMNILFACWLALILFVASSLWVSQGVVEWMNKSKVVGLVLIMLGLMLGAFSIVMLGGSVIREMPTVKSHKKYLTIRIVQPLPAVQFR